MKKMIFVLFVFLIACSGPAVAPTFTSLPPTDTPIPSLIPTFTPSSTPSPTATLTPTITPIPNELTDEKGVTMRLVPAGEFTMGSKAEDVLAECKKYTNDCQLNWFEDAEPLHQVYLDAFYMDIYEVTNVTYRACVEAGACLPPIQSNSYTRTAYYSDPEFDEFPVIYVDWNMAKTYCEWRGASLPTEAQWEKAARGTDGRTYPWGEGIDCSRANYIYPCKGETTKVGSYESGKSPFGMYDMAGNVWEWVADWYSDTYYQNSPSANPLGPDSGQYRVLRGGSWDYYGYGVRSAFRLRIDPAFSDNVAGFRCACSVP